MREECSGPYLFVPAATHKPCARFVKIHLLQAEPLYFIVEAKSRSKELQSQVCEYMKSCGMLDTHLFGLATLIDGEYVFIDPEYKLSKYAPKGWKSSSTNGLDSNGKPLLEFYFHVQFYVRSPLLLQDEVSLEHYYKQVCKNVLERGIGDRAGLDVSYLNLGGLALQAEYGDCYQPHYYAKPHRYLPRQMVERCGERKLSEKLGSAHRGNSGLSRSEARLEYIREASSSDIFPIAYNCHVYRLRTSKQEPLPGSVLLAISTNGLHTYHESAQKSTNGKFLWNEIGKLSFDRKKFEIRGTKTGKKLSYLTSRDEKSKHLLLLCRVSHEYSMSVESQLDRLDDLERKGLRDWPAEVNKYTWRYSTNGEQRISVISSTSSTTTSGIVSDRVQSLDESEDDLDVEIVLRSESVLTSSHSQPVQCEQSHGGEETSKASVTPATTEGSQCSSSASTIVTARQQQAQRLLLRRESVTSSLELEREECDLDSIHCTTSSGVYTLDDSSDQQVFLAPSPLKESSDQRSRSGSVVSHSGSFHGDGSDPSDAGRCNPLSAEELSNLIVHRSPKPRRGVYPSRATVSSTLDSCSDYVTLPPPPAPPLNHDTDFFQEDQAKLISLNLYQYRNFPDRLYPLNSLPSPTPYDLNSTYIPSSSKTINTSSGYLSQSDYLDDAKLEASARMKITSSLMPIVGSNNYLDVRQSYLQQYQEQCAAIPSQQGIHSLTQNGFKKQALQSMADQSLLMSIPCQEAIHMKNQRSVSDPPSHHLLSAQYLTGCRPSIHQPLHQILSQSTPRLITEQLPNPPPYRHPPPPPPRPNLATVYTNQVSRSEIEQFKQELYSDVDYVMYPLKDPALSKQEYLDCKLARDLRERRPPPYPAGKNMIYRSTPNVAIDSSYIAHFNKSLNESRFASNQNLSASSFFSTSPLYSQAGSYSSSSTHSLLYDPLQFSLSTKSFFRTLSHDNILNSERPLLSDKVRYRRPPPPVPSDTTIVEKNGNESEKGPGSETPETPLDISSLREKSRNLDLPLISALCNDRSLLKQTNAFVMPKHPDRGRPVSWHVLTSTSPSSPEKKSIFSTLLSKSISNPTPSSKHSKLKYPVSGMSTNQIVKGNRRTPSRHKHPQNKLDENIRNSGGSSSKDIKC